MNTCAACGTSNPDHARFCSQCGISVRAHDESSPEHPAAPTTMTVPVLPQSTPAAPSGATTYVVCPKCGQLNKTSAGRCRQVISHRLEGAPRVTVDHKLGFADLQRYAIGDADKRDALLRQWGVEGDLTALLVNATRRPDPRGALNEQMVCPHCQTKGSVRTKRVTVKGNISGGKATGAILTGGVSLLVTGLSRMNTVTQAKCDSCSMSWAIA